MRLLRYKILALFVLLVLVSFIALTNYIQNEPTTGSNSIQEEEIRTYSCTQSPTPHSSTEPPTSSSTSSIKACIIAAATETHLYDEPYRCVSLPDYSEFCLYRNVCLAGQKLLLVGNGNHFPQAKDDSIDSFLNLPALNTGSPEEIVSSIFPRRSFLNLNWEFIEKPLSTPYLPFGFLTGFDSDGPNIFHFSENVLLYNSLQQMNGSLFKLPPLNVTLLSRPKPPQGSWISEFSSILFDRSRILWSDEIRDISASNPMCFQHLAIQGTIIPLTLGVKDAEQLKSKVYRRIGVPIARSRPPRMIVFEQRDSRTWTNSAELIEIIKKTGIPYKVVSLSTLSFQEQVKTLAAAGIFCSAHGAGLTNVLWMPTGAAVIEAFPSKVWQYNLYRRISENSGLFHFSIYGTPKDSNPNFDGKVPYDCLNDGGCNMGLKQDFYLPPSKFEEALLNAINLAGI